MKRPSIILAAWTAISLLLLAFSVAAAPGPGAGSAAWSAAPAAEAPAPAAFPDAEALAGALRAADPVSAPLVAEAFLDERRADGRSLETVLRAVLPPADFFIALTTDSDSRRELAGMGRGGNAFGSYYAALAARFDRIDDDSARWRALLDAAWLRLPPSAREGLEARAPMIPSDRSLPTVRSLRYNHQDAIDIFYPVVKRKGAEEIGPTVRSMSYGLVVAAETGWTGGSTEASYVSGGLSPRAGNGVIVYSPDEGRFYSYFHLHDVTVRPGQALEPGQSLGHGGNTGLNARKSGHGKHLHLEIFDVARGESLDCYELRAMVASRT
ncbi:MAG TPA: M23 family metallopeptidase [Spirochaetales bacterium]|nr:M23 family metallopeptidase [Spirochaetales bacterium]